MKTILFILILFVFMVLSFSNNIPTGAQFKKAGGFSFTYSRHLSDKIEGAFQDQKDKRELIKSSF